MRAPVVLSFFVAALFHAVLLFGFQFGTLARPLPMGDGPASLEVGLAGGPESGDAAQQEAPAEPQATPKPQPAPQPTPALPPEPAPTPEPTPEPLPPPEPVPAVEPAATPVPRPSPQTTPRPAANPHPQTSAPARHTGPADGKPRSGHAAGGGGSGTGGGAGGTSALPRYRTNPKPVYPPEARRQRQEGVVLLNVEIGADGQAASVTVKQTSGFPLLDQSALQAVRRWTFAPATAAGLPVASHADIPIRFNLSQ